jgi:hypothetical protein
LSLLVAAILAAFRQTFHLSTCPDVNAGVKMHQPAGVKMHRL